MADTRFAARSRARRGHRAGRVHRAAENTTAPTESRTSSIELAPIDAMLEGERSPTDEVLDAEAQAAKRARRAFAAVGPGSRTLGR
jgi:hypothetical protein